MKIFLLIFLISYPDSSTSPISQKSEKELSPYMPVILNTGGMVVSYGLVGGLFWMITGEDDLFLPNRAEEILGSISSTFIFSTIPGHIYVKDHPAKTIFFLLTKFFIMGVYIFAEVEEGLGRIGAEAPRPISITDDVVFVSSLGAIWLYETIDNIFTVKRYNKRLMEERSTSFYLQPIITPKGDIFLTGGIRF